MQQDLPRRSALLRQVGADCLDDLSSRWHNPEGSQSPAIDDRLPVDEHSVLGITTVDHVNVDSKVTSELRRHPGGVQTRQSIRAVTDCYPGHWHSPPLNDIPSGDLTRSGNCPLDAVKVQLQFREATLISPEL